LRLDSMTSLGCSMPSGGSAQRYMAMAMAQLSQLPLPPRTPGE